MEKENDKQTEPKNNVESTKNSDFKTEEDSKNDEIDPFYFKRNTGCCNVIQIIAMTPIALIRLTCIIFLLLVAWLIARYDIKLNVNNDNFCTKAFKSKKFIKKFDIFHGKLQQSSMGQFLIEKSKKIEQDILITL